MNKLLTIFFLLFFQSILAQKTLSGKVVVAGTSQPVSSASVYINNTSIGTTTDDKGIFKLDRLPTDKFDLIVSCIGYETYVLSIDYNQIESSLIIQVKPKIKELTEVIVGGYEKDGWQKWGQFFLEHFIGRSSFANDCDILNTDVIHFRLNKKDNILSVVTDEPLIIENKSLGYVLKYQMEQFDYNFNDHFLSYYGYPFFQQMPAKRASQLKRWNKNREQAYYGSIMHFMRSVYRNTLIEEGFEVRKLIRQPNKEKQRIKELYKSRMIKNLDGTITMGKFPQDSSSYYSHVMSMPDATDYLIKTILPGDSIAYATDSITVLLAFNDFLDITYKNAKEPYEYVQQMIRPTRAVDHPNSKINLLRDKLIQVLSNGNYYDPSKSLISYGFWAWTMMADLLPFDYKLPPKINK